MPTLQGQTIELGTCLVAIRTPDEIILGADSLTRISERTDLGTTRDRFVEECKIKRERNIVFAVAGFSSAEDDKDPNKRVNIPELVADSIRSSIDIASSLARIEPAIENGLDEYIRCCPNEEHADVMAGLERHIEVVI